MAWQRKLGWGLIIISIMVFFSIASQAPTLSKISRAESLGMLSAGVLPLLIGLGLIYHSKISNLFKHNSDQTIRYRIAPKRK